MTSVEREGLDERQLIRKERVEFLLYYVEWIKRTPNREWSRQQAEFIDSCLSGNDSPALSPEQYLRVLKKGKRHT